VNPQEQADDLFDGLVPEQQMPGFVALDSEQDNVLSLVAAVPRTGQDVVFVPHRVHSCLTAAAFDSLFGLSIA
jgi:hypothetical protein